MLRVKIQAVVRKTLKTNILSFRLEHYYTQAVSEHDLANAKTIFKQILKRCAMLGLYYYFLMYRYIYIYSILKLKFFLPLKK